MALIVAAPEPETLAKIILAPTVVMAVPPRSHERRAEAKFTMRLAMPPFAMMAPARMKSGMAMYENELMPSKNCFTTMNIGKLLPK